MPRRTVEPQPQPPGPFVRMLLDLVAEVCAPSAPAWRAALSGRLAEVLYRRFTDGHRLTPDDLNALVWSLEALELKVRALEERLTPPPPPGPDEVEVSNTHTAGDAAGRRPARRPLANGDKENF
jgi:hypothetical protein